MFTTHCGVDCLLCVLVRTFAAQSKSDGESSELNFTSYLRRLVWDWLSMNMMVKQSNIYLYNVDFGFYFTNIKMCLCCAALSPLLISTHGSCKHEMKMRCRTNDRLHFHHHYNYLDIECLRLRLCPTPGWANGPGYTFSNNRQFTAKTCKIFL